MLALLKIIGIVVLCAFVVGVLLCLAVVLWLSWESSQGRNPFQ